MATHIQEALGEKLEPVDREPEAPAQRPAVEFSPAGLPADRHGANLHTADRPSADLQAAELPAVLRTAIRSLPPLVPTHGAVQVEPPVPHAPSSHCPGCENQHAQRVPVIFEALMAQIRSRRPNSGAVRVGAVLWGTFPGVGAKLSLAGDQHQLARRLAPPVIDSTNLVEAGRSRVAAAGGGALVAFLVVMIPLVVWSHPAPAGPEGPSPGPTHLPSFETALAIAALFGLPLLVFAKISSRYDAHIDRLRRAEWEAFDRRKQAWKSSFFCHACGKIFHPSGRAE